MKLLSRIMLSSISPRRLVDEEKMAVSLKLVFSPGHVAFDAQRVIMLWGH